LIDGIALAAGNGAVGVRGIEGATEQFSHLQV